MQLTLLELVQKMLASIEAENISTISGSEEAGMCVEIANRAFGEMIYSHPWKHLRSSSALSAGANLNTLVGPANCIAIESFPLYYETNLVRYIDPEDFLFITRQRDSAAANVDTINGLYIYNDRNPTYFTTFDDDELVFDAIPTGAGLVAADTLAMVMVGPSTELSTDNQIFNLPAKAFPALLARCLEYTAEELAGDSQRAARHAASYRKLMTKFALDGSLVRLPKQMSCKIIRRRPGYTPTIIQS